MNILNHIWQYFFFGLFFIYLNPLLNASVNDPDISINVDPLAKPSYGQIYTDAAFDTQLRRIGNASNGGMDRHEYSQLQAFNADSTLIMQTTDNGITIRDVLTLETIFNNFDGGSYGNINSPNWNPSNANEVYYFDDNADETIRLLKVNVRTGQEILIQELPAQYLRIFGSTSWEEISYNGKYKVIYVSRRDGGYSILLLNLLTGQIITDIDDDTTYGPNWVAASPGGNYIVVQWNQSGVGQKEGVAVYDKSGGYQGHVHDTTAHGDLGFDENGNEIYVTLAFGNDLLIVSTVLPGSANFTSGHDKILLDPNWDNADHISCKGPAGLCVITSGSSGMEPFAGEIYLVYTAGIAADYGENSNAIVSRLTQHRSSQCSYYHQPHASISRDGKYVVFASDWGQCNKGVNDYLIYLNPDDIPEQPDIPNNDTDPDKSKYFRFQIKNLKENNEIMHVEILNKNKENIESLDVPYETKGSPNNVSTEQKIINMLFDYNSNQIIRFNLNKHKILIKNWSNSHKIKLKNLSKNKNIKSNQSENKVIFNKFNTLNNYLLVLKNDNEKIKIRLNFLD